eukprot:6207295-Pleurochrysis_carterae.AAC.2
MNRIASAGIQCPLLKGEGFHLLVAVTSIDQAQNGWAYVFRSEKAMLFYTSILKSKIAIPATWYIKRVPSNERRCHSQRSASLATHNTGVEDAITVLRYGLGATSRCAVARTEKYPAKVNWRRDK